MRSQETIFRKTPYVLIKYIIIINVALAFILAATASWIDYRALYSNASISEILSFDISSIAVVSILEILSVIFLLRNWLKDYYTVCENEITHQPLSIYKEKMNLSDIRKITETPRFM